MKLMKNNVKCTVRLIWSLSSFACVHQSYTSLNNVILSLQILSYIQEYHMLLSCHTNISMIDVAVMLSYVFQADPNYTSSYSLAFCSVLARQHANVKPIS